MRNLGRLLELPLYQLFMPEVRVGGSNAEEVRAWLKEEGFLMHVEQLVM